MQLCACSAGVGGDGVASNEATGATTGEAVGETKEALSGWVGPISDENWKSFGTCGSADTGITQARCAGRYCDDVSVLCAALPPGTTRPYNTYYNEDWISEEAPGYRLCDQNNDGVIDGVIAGMTASGSYSDNISLQCVPLAAGLGNRYCTWTGWFSEEQGLLDFGGMKAVDVACSGRYCDNMAYYVCQF